MGRNIFAAAAVLGDELERYGQWARQVFKPGESLMAVIMHLCLPFARQHAGSCESEGESTAGEIGSKPKRQANTAATRRVTNQL